MAIDILSAFTLDPQPLDFVWHGFLSGSVGALVSPGGVGKSFWALEAAMSVACGVPGGDLLGLKPSSGRVIYLAGEDPEPALIQRIHAIGRHLNPEARKSISENLVIQPIMGAMLDIMNELHHERVIELCTGARLVVLDTLSRIHQVDENSNGEMARLVAILEHVAVTTGAAVLFLHHVNKGSAREGQLDQQQAARGASALIDNARWCGYVAKMTEDEAKRLNDRRHAHQPIGDQRGFFIRFGVSKQNYDATTLDQWYERREGGVLVPVELVEASNGKKEGTREQA